MTNIETAAARLREEIDAVEYDPAVRLLAIVQAAKVLLTALEGAKVDDGVTCTRSWSNHRGKLDWAFVSDKTFNEKKAPDLDGKRGTLYFSEGT